MMVNVQLEDYELLDMLLDRVAFWREDQTIIDLYKKMYQYRLDSGYFEAGEFNVMSIVDNDVTNWCDVFSKNDYPQDFDKLLKLYKEDKYDVSCEEFEDIHPSFIEAVSDDEECILVRY